MSALIAQGAELLAIARRAAERRLGLGLDGQDLPACSPSPNYGVFVTFWAANRLRGCVGTIGSSDDLAGCVEEATLASLADPRFCDQPITREELPGLTIEVSLLSDPLPLRNLEDLILGHHGVMVRRGDRSGCFLPRVAVEKGWSAEKLLANCCSMKAGLPEDAWRDDSTQVRLFTVQCFRELGSRV